MADDNQAVVPMEGRAKRERKAVVPLVTEVQFTKDAWSPSGSGTELGSMQYFCGMIEKFKDDDEPIRALHLLCIGSVGKKGQRKKLLRQFNGFSGSTSALQIEAKLSENKKKWTVPQLKDVSRILGLDVSGSRADLIKRLSEYVISPYELKSGSAVSSTKKRKKTAPGNTKKQSRKAARTGEPKKKKPMGAYMLYSNEVRPRVKAENPDEGFGGLSKIVGAMWRALSHDEKQVWEAKAAALKAAGGEAADDHDADDNLEEDEEEGEEEEDEDDDEAADNADTAHSDNDVDEAESGGDNADTAHSDNDGDDDALNL